MRQVINVHLTKSTEGKQCDFPELAGIT